MQSSCVSLAITFLALALPAAAQVSIGGTPASFEQELTTPLVTEWMPEVDLQTLLLEDDLRPQPAPYRFGATIAVHLDAQERGTWEVLPNGDRLWRLRIASPQAYSINLIFERYWVPSGATLHLYNDDHSDVLGAFTEFNVKDHGMFAVMPVSGDAITLEYREPRDALRSGELVISRVVHAYRDTFAKVGFEEGSGSCNVNVACPQAAAWADQARSACRIVMTATLCSGAMINNTNFDGRQYLLTADHCDDGLEPLWVFDFNYQSAACSGTNGPNNTSALGATIRARSPASDYCLVEVTETIPASYNVFLAGWNSGAAAPTSSACIHHPSGDIKKFSRDDHAATPVISGGGQCWNVIQWDLGVTEPGSSGSPLFDQNKRIVGQLFGGSSACGNPFNDLYGRFDVTWQSGAAVWLDPSGTGTVALDGANLPAPTTNPSPYCTAKLTSAATLPSVGWTGQPKLSTNDFVVTCSNALPNKNGIAFYGGQPKASPFLGGTLCAKPPLTRTALFQFDSAGATTLAVPVTAGDIGVTRYYQFWFRDPAHPDNTTVGFSNALRVTFEP